MQSQEQTTAQLLDELEMLRAIVNEQPETAIAELLRINQQLRQQLQECRQVEAALRVSQARFAGIVEIADDAIISIDQTQRITLFNRGAERVFGYKAEEVLGRSLDILLPQRTILSHRQHIQNFGDSYGQARRMGQSLRRTADQRQPILGRRKDGTEFPAEASISRLVQGDEVIFTVILRDITNRQQVEQMKDEFISIVSHELRTPLTSIHGSLGMLASGLLDSSSERGQRLLQIAVDSSDRLVRLINDILDIERIESGKVTMAKETCDVVTLIHEAVDTVQAIAERRQITLSVCTISAALWADPDRVIQTLTNLLSNAIKFSPPGNTIWLTAEFWQEEGSHNPQPTQVVFTVRDRGRGIPASKIDSIFERFQQVDASDSRNSDGTGLGLAICRSIVQQHHGRIWVESVLGEGSTFSFTIPLARTVVPDDLLTSSLEDTSKPLVLVCDDDASTLEVLRVLLEQRGYRVVTVDSGQVAIEQAIALHPAMILLDILMPEMNGWDVMAALKAHPDTASIPIVICSVSSQGEAPQGYQDYVDWVDKPIDSASLFQSLRRALSGSTRPCRILIIEDDAKLSQELAHLFQQHDIETACAQTGREAIHLSQHLDPDLLVLDLSLPGNDGFAVVEWLRQHNRLSSVPLVVYSAKDLDERERDRLRLGQTEFLTKGQVSPEEFEHRVMELLHGITRVKA